MKLKVNYSQSLKTLVKAGKFDYQYINSGFSFNTEKKTATLEVELLHLNKVLTTKEVLEEVKQRGFRLLTIQEALEFAHQYPDEQRKNWLATIDVQLWCLILSRDGSKRYLNVHQCHLGHNWREDCRFLVASSLDSLTPGASGVLDSWTLKKLDEIDTIVREIRERK